MILRWDRDQNEHDALLARLPRCPGSKDRPCGARVPNPTTTKQCAYCWNRDRLAWLAEAEKP